MRRIGSMSDMYAKDIILNPRQPLDYLLLEWLKKELLEKNPELYRFMLESVGKEHPTNVGTWDRQIDAAVIGMALLGAIDMHLEPSSYVRVKPDSIARAQNRRASMLVVEIKGFNPDIGKIFTDAFACVRDANRELNNKYGSSINNECIVQGVALCFDAYWQELRKQCERKWFNS